MFYLPKLQSKLQNIKYYNKRVGRRIQIPHCMHFDTIQKRCF